MTYYVAIQLCNERYREGLGGAERVDDELLSVIADIQGPKRGDCHLGYRAHIGVGFAPDNDLRIHVLRVPPSCNPTLDFSRGALRCWRERLLNKTTLIEDLSGVESSYVLRRVVDRTILPVG